MWRRDPPGMRENILRNCPPSSRQLQPSTPKAQRRCTLPGQEEPWITDREVGPSWYAWLLELEEPEVGQDAAHRPGRPVADPDRECHSRPQVRRGVESSPLGALRRQRRLAGGAGAGA